MQLLQISRDTAGGARTADSANLSITDNLDLRIRVLMARWRPTGNEQTFFSKRQAGNEWHFRTQDLTGRLQFLWWDTGGVENVETASADVPMADGTTAWVRVRRAGTSVNFWYSTDNTNNHASVTWTALGATQTTPSGSIRSNVATHVLIGTAFAFAGGESLDGYVYAGAILDNTTVRASPDFTDTAQWAPGDGLNSTGVDAQGNTWQLDNAGLIVGDNLYGVPGVWVGTHVGFGETVTSIGGSAGAAADWFDITKDVEAINTERGRNYQLDRMDIGLASFQLDNISGHYNANNTTSPYYPNVKPMVPIRFRAIFNGILYRLWQGFVDRWPVSFPGNSDSKVTVECSDLFAVLARARAGEKGRIATVRDLNPVAWWRMSGNATEDLSDSGSHVLSWSGDHFIEQSGVWTGDEAVNLVGTNGHASIANEPDIEREHKDRSWEFWVRPSAAGYVMDMINAAGTRRLMSLQFVGAGWVSQGGNTGSGHTLSTAATVSQWHHLVITDTMQAAGQWHRRLYFNGLFVDDHVYGDPVDNWIVRIGSSNGAGGTWFTGDISEIVTYPTALTPAEVAGLYAAQFESYETERTDERIEFILSTPEFGIGTVIPDLDLDVGISEISGVGSPTDISALEAVQIAADTERGNLFITGSGAVRFQNRHYRIFEQDTPIATFNQADWTTPVIGNDLDLLANHIQVSVAENSLPFEVEDQTSIDAYGRATLQIEIYPADANEGLDAAHYLLDRYKDPRQRLQALDWDLGPLCQVDPTSFALVLAAELSDRYNIEIPLTGDDLDVDVFLEHVSHMIDLSGRWSSTWQLSMADVEGPFWLLGVSGFSELGVTTWLGY